MLDLAQLGHPTGKTACNMLDPSGVDQSGASSPSLDGEGGLGGKMLIKSKQIGHGRAY